MDINLTIEESRRADHMQRRERDAIDAVAETEYQIAILQKKLAKQKETLQWCIKDRQKCRAHAFQKQYGYTIQKVIDDYVILIRGCCYQGGIGYSVNVPGTNPGGASHWVLRPEKREICEPTPLVKEAFAIIGQEVSIADKPHLEVWGN